MWPRAAEGAPDLREGAALEREIGRGETHAYDLHLGSGHFVEVTVHQQGADVRLVLEDPDGEILLAVDGPNGPEGPEELVALAADAGTHRLLVEAAGAGSYRLEVEALRAPGERDLRLAEAWREYVRAEALRRVDEEAARQRALAGYRRVLELTAGLDAPLLEARAHRRAGLLLDDAGEACRHLEAALDLLRVHGNGWELVPTLNDAGVARLELGRVDESLAAFEEALDLAEHLGYRGGKAAALSNLGILHHSLGELQAALDYYDRSLAERRAAGDPGRTGTVLHNLGRIYTVLGRLEESRDFLDRALEVRRRVEDRHGEAVTLTALAWLSFLERDLDAASAGYDRALTILVPAGDSADLAVALEGRAAVHRERDRPERALAGLERARTIFERRGQIVDSLNTRLEIGRLRLSTGDHGAALASLRRALDGFTELGAIHGQALARLDMGRAERARGGFPEALQHFEAALEAVDSLRARIAAGGLRASYAATRHDDYGDYVDLLMELDRREPGGGWAARAFEVSERVRARGLVESLVAEAPVPAGVAARRASLRRAIRARETRRIEATARGVRGAEGEVLDRGLRALLLDYEKLEGDLRTASGASVAAGPWTLERVRREILDPETLLLVYRLGETRSFLWQMDSERFETHLLPGRTELEALARQAHALLPRSHERGRELATRLALEELGDHLLGAVSGTLDRQDLDPRRVVIVSDGALQLIPFGVLPVPGPGDREPLLARREVVHLPSLAALAVLRARQHDRPAATKLLAMIADPVFQAGDPRLGVPRPGEQGASRELDRDVRRSIDDFGLEGFERLPFSGKEAEAVLALVPEGERFAAVGVVADRDAVLGGTLGPYRIVHFATHGLLNARHPALSGLVLSRFDAGGRPRPGLVWAHELDELELSAELVVLSACRTALGKEVRGEGLLAMPRSFFRAGVPRVVVSHWSVSDRATAELMRRFYRGLLEEGLRPPAALRKAQLEMRAEPGWRAPYYWGGFVLQGEWR